MSKRRVQVHLHIAVYLPVKGHMTLSNDVCLRRESCQAQEPQAVFVGHILKVRREKSHARSKRLVSLSSSFVRSLALAPSPPMMDPTHRPVGRSQATTDAQDRVGTRWIQAQQPCIGNRQGSNIERFRLLTKLPTT